MTEALLALEDGRSFPGRAVGARGETFGEVVFNTGMSGYQEVLTDPSYAGQIVVMTYPHQGNYGVNEDDPESGSVRVAGFVVREAVRRPSSWRARGSLPDYLEAAGVVGIEDIDTRALTLHIREAGAMRAGISTEDLEPASLVSRVREQPEMLGADLARTVSAPAPYRAEDLVGPARRNGRRPFRVAALDWGLKRNSLRLLHRSGCQTVVFPALTPAAEILAGGFDGVFLSNGPGDPAATEYAVEAARGLLGNIPVFGICLGHQVLSRALGGTTYKLKFGHRGANQPVLDLETGRVDVTSHNHGFAVDPTGWPAVSTVGTPPGGATFTGTTGAPRAAAHGRGGDPRRNVWEPRSPDDAALPSRFGSGWDPTAMTAAARSTPPVVETAFGGVALTHWNLNDGTLEGLRCLDVPALSVQYHPEAAPGPHDAAPLFDRFVELMDRA